MFNKFILGAIISLLALPTFAADRAIVFEFGFGFGDSKGISYTRDEQKEFKLDMNLCRNRNASGMKFFAVRYRQNEIELHGARWWHDASVDNCSRSSNAVGLGYVISTEDRGTRGNDDIHLSWTPGIAYTWGADKRLNGVDTDANWRLHGNWQVFNRVAVGVGNDDVDLEFAVHRYGSFDLNHGETFWTIGIVGKDLEKNDPVVNNTPNDPPIDPPTCTENCGDPEDPPTDDGGNGNHSGGGDGTNPGGHGNEDGTDNPGQGHGNH